MEEILENINWKNINENNLNYFIPPLKFAKVIKIINGNTIKIAAKIPLMNETLENSNLYKFRIHLNGILAPQITPMIKNDIALNSRDELSKLILNKIIELKNITLDKHGKLFANIFLDNTNVNEWSLQNNLSVKSKNEGNRRLSESDSNYTYNYNKVFPNITIESILNSSLSPKKIDNLVLPPITSVTSETLVTPRHISNSSSIILSDCFLSHNWGENKINHKSIGVINSELKKRGLSTWFDENKINGNIRFKMAEGIDNTKCVVVFITKEYKNKVNGIDMKDNCKYEFTYAMNQLGSHNMIPVIMEPEMKETQKWKGELGAALGSMLFIDLSDENLSISELNKKYDELCRRVKAIIHRNEKIKL